MRHRRLDFLQKIKNLKKIQNFFVFTVEKSYFMR